MNRPIPPFYCVYLLRSRCSPRSEYVGSTPHPCRRLKQHNGKGGAAASSKKPWDMVAMVTGFPSKIAALQFEWAWQNPHLTRHILDSQRVSIARVRYSKGKKRYFRPPISHGKRLENLYLLLRSKSFLRWPLQLKFLDDAVYTLWQKMDVKVPAMDRHAITITVESQKVSNSAHADDAQPNAIGPFDIGFNAVLPQLKKSMSVYNKDFLGNCSVCREGLNPKEELALTCVGDNCTMMAHLTCLSELFLQQEGSTRILLPKTGKCPTCSTKLVWYDLMRDISLRIRGLTEVNKITKASKTKTSASCDVQADTQLTEDDSSVRVSIQTPGKDGSETIEEVNLVYVDDGDDDVPYVDEAKPDNESEDSDFTFVRTKSKKDLPLGKKIKSQRTAGRSKPGDNRIPAIIPNSDPFDIDNVPVE